MDKKSFLFATLLAQDIPMIDLHFSENPTDALIQLERELYALANQKTQYCRVIHGIGNGVLSRVVHNALDAHPLVRARDEDEHGGTCLIAL